MRRPSAGGPITRRDFIDGVAVTAAFGASRRALAALDPGAGVALQDHAGYYPPTLTAMRGGHPGSFEVAHALRDGTFLKAGTTPVDTGERYDLIVVGGGISGLAAAYFYRAKVGPAPASSSSRTTTILAGTPSGTSSNLMEKSS